MFVIIICTTGAIAIPLLVKLKNRYTVKNNTVSDKTGKSRNKLIRYDTYNFGFWERIKYLIPALIIFALVGYMFFKNLIITFIICTLSFLYLPVKKRNILKKRKTELMLQFRNMLQSISASLSAGRSVEGSFKEALEDQKIFYQNEDTYIIHELKSIIRRIDMHEPVETALKDFAKRSDIEDIMNFVDVFVICRNTGGNLVEVVKNTCSVINQKIEIKNEIEVMIAEKKLSQRIMNIMPFGLLLLIITGSPEYIKPLYTPKGNIVMSIVLCILLISYFIGVRIMDIKI